MRLRLVMLQKLFWMVYLLCLVGTAPTVTAEELYNYIDYPAQVSLKKQLAMKHLKPLGESPLGAGTYGTVYPAHCSVKISVHDALLFAGTTGPRITYRCALKVFKIAYDVKTFWYSSDVDAEAVEALKKIKNAKQNSVNEFSVMKDIAKARPKNLLVPLGYYQQAKKINPWKELVKTAVVDSPAVDGMLNDLPWFVVALPLMDGNLSQLIKTRELQAQPQPKTWRTWFESDKKVDWRNENFEIMLQALNGLRELHEQIGYIHTDIKPANILYYRDGNQKIHVRISDFETAKKHYKAWYDLRKNEKLTTIWWRAPELILQNSYNEKIDIFSLGCAFYELVTGKYLFIGDREHSEKSQLQAIMQVSGSPSDRDWSLPIPNPRWRDLRESWLAKRLTDQPECVVKLFARMIAISPEQRPSAAEALNELTACRASWLAHQR